MNKVLLVTVSCLLLLASCGESKNSSDSQLPQQEKLMSEKFQESEEKEVMSLSQMVSQVPNVYSQSNHFRACVVRNTDECIRQESSLNESEKGFSCEDYLLAENKDSCLRAKTMEKARNSGDASLCDSLQSGKNFCVYEVIMKKAMEKRDTAGCADIEENSLVQKCNNQVLTSLALEKLDTSICDKIKSNIEGDNIEQDICKQEVEFEKKMKQEDERMQKELKLEELKNQEAAKLQENTNQKVVTSTSASGAAQ